MWMLENMLGCCDVGGKGGKAVRVREDGVWEGLQGQRGRWGHY